MLYAERMAVWFGRHTEHTNSLLGAERRMFSYLLIVVQIITTGLGVNMFTVA
jgi:hypothetical protein